MTPPPVSAAVRLDGTLADALAERLQTGDLQDLYGAGPTDRRDRFLTLLQVYDLHTAPLESLGESARYQGHPVVADLKSRLEATWLRELEALPLDAGDSDATTPDGAVEA